MSTRPPPRSAEQRKQDTLDRLSTDVDCWVATADPASGLPYMIPLSFSWDGTDILLATLAEAVTSRNLVASGTVRLGFGSTRDVIMVDGTAEPIPEDQIPAEVGDAFAAQAGFDPRTSAGLYLYFRIRPQRIQAWREANEIRGRDLMREGRWLVDS